MHQDVEPLQRLNAPDREQHALILGDAELRAGGRAVPGHELIERDTERDHGHTLRRHAEHLAQQAAFVLCRRHDAVERVHEPALGLQSLDRLVLRGAGAQLHIAQRVEHPALWHAPARGEQPPRDGREPVVRIDDVVAQTLARPEGLDAVRELAGEGDHPFVLERLRRPGRHRHQPRTRCELLDLGRRAVGAAREDVDGDAERAELRGDLADVDVHPAGDAAAEGREGRGVHREHRDAFGHRVRAVFGGPGSGHAWSNCAFRWAAASAARESAGGTPRASSRWSGRSHASPT